MVNKEEELNPSSRYRKAVKTIKDEIEEKMDILLKRNENLRREMEEDHISFIHMQDRMYWVAIGMLIIGLIVGFYLRGIIFG